MKTLTVSSSKGRYPVFIGKKLLKKIASFVRPVAGKKETLKVFLLSQKKVAEKYAGPVRSALKRSGYPSVLHLLPDGEKAKSQAELFKIYRRLLKEKMERKDLILALGGGAIGDVGGFAASTYLRGIAFANIATTLLAQVDSALGGKTAINLPEGKNLVGTFYPPRFVLSDIEVLKTLPLREYRSSMAEVIKYGMIRDAGLFALLEKQADKVLHRESGILQRIVRRCAGIKGGVVSRDEEETKGERMILNYGHTFGHGLEKALNYRRLMHGEAVAAGMVCAARLAVRLKMFSPSEEKRQNVLIQKYGLPVSLAPFALSASRILKAMMHDKKKSGGVLRFILPVRIGRVQAVRGISSKLLESVLIETGASA